MSKNDMVIVPRELLERCKQFTFDILSPQALRSDIDAALDKPAQQRQGEPVAWRCEARNGGTGRYSRTADTEEEMRSFVAHYEGIGAIIQVTPLYTHADPGEVVRFGIQVEKLLCEALGREWSATGISIETLVAELKAKADPGEAERLRGIIRMHEKTVREQTDHLAYMRAQLAERDALLHSLDCAWNSHDGKERFGKLMRKVETLAASAEQSAPVECDESGLNAERYLFLRNMGVDRSPGRERCLSVSVEDWADNLAPPPAGVATCGAWSSMELRGEELDREVDKARAALERKP